MAKEKSLAVIEPSEYAVMKLGEGEMASLIKENCAGGVDRFDMDKVTMPTGGGLQFAVPNLEGSEDMVDSIEGVCILFKDGRSMWHESFDEGGGGGPPDCSSSDMTTGIGDPGGSCLACPLSRFGSGKGNSQKCKQTRLLFVLRPDTLLPLIVALPPTSLKAAKKYFLRLTTHGVAYHQVVTRLSLERDKNDDGVKYSKIVLGMVNKIKDPEASEFASLSVVFGKVFSSTDVARIIDDHASEN